MMPDPTTVATNKAVPTASAVSRAMSVGWAVCVTRQVCQKSRLNDSFFDSPK